MFRCYYAFICPGNLLYLNRIPNPNPEYVTGANIPKQRLKVFLKFSGEIFTDKFYHEFTIQFFPQNSGA